VDRPGLPLDKVARRIKGSFLANFVGLWLGCMSIALGIVGAIDAASLLLIFGSAVLAALGALMVYLVIRGDFLPPAEPARLDLVRRNYPDVPVYPSLRAALRAHPLTVPERPSPQTCDDFWTRAA